MSDFASCPTRRVAIAKAEGKLYFDGFGTSKALDNSYFRIVCVCSQGKGK